MCFNFPSYLQVCHMHLYRIQLTLVLLPRKVYFMDIPTRSNLKFLAGKEMRHCESTSNKARAALIIGRKKEVFPPVFPFFILLIHEGSHREVYHEFQSSYDTFSRWCKGLFRPQVPWTPILHCPIASSASTQSQQPVQDG